MRNLVTLAWVLCVAAAAAQQPFDLDTTFRTDIQLNGSGGAGNVSSMHVFADGSVLLSGSMFFPGEGIARLLAKVLPDGSRDESFPYACGRGRLVPWNDRFYVGCGQAVRRYWPNGIEDDTFDMLAAFDEFTPGQAGNYHVFEDGRVVLTGDHMIHDAAHGFEGYYQLIWFTNEGRLDTTRIHRRCDGFIYRIFPLPDGKFLLSGSWTEYEGTPVPNSTRLIRVFGDGSLDSTFHSPFDFGRPHSHNLLPDGKHLLTGIMGLTNDEDTIQIVRLLPDGGLDSSFNAHLQLLYAYDNDPAFSDITTALALGEDRYIITGGFTHIDGQPRGGIALIDTSGQLLNTEFTGPGCGMWNDGFQDRGYITGIVPSPDGSYYIHGSYYGYDDGTVNDPNQRMVSRLYGLDVGVEHQGPLTRITVYPNPASHSFRLVGVLPGEQVMVTLYDNVGCRIRSWSGAEANEDLSLEGLPPGLYPLVVQRPDRGSERAKLIVR